MADIENILQQILDRLTGLEAGQQKVEARLDKLEARLHKVERVVDGQQNWFQTLGQKADALERTVDAVRGELGEMRDLMAHLRDDDIVARHAIADLSRRQDALEERAG